MLVWKYFYRLSFPSLFSSSSFLVWRMDNLFLKSIFMLIEQFSDFQFQSTMFGNHINYVGLSLASTYTTKMFFTYLLHLYREYHDVWSKLKRVWISIFWYTFLNTLVLLFLSCFIFCEINFSLKSSLSKRKIPRSYFPLLLCIILTLLPLLLSHFEVFPPSSPPPPANTLWQNFYNCSVKKEYLNTLTL